MNELWIIVPNWDKFQHYRDRQPTWIKLYTDLVHRDEWRELTCAECGLLVRVWLEFALSRGQLRMKDVPNLVGSSFRPSGLKALTDAGFLQLSASKPLALRAHGRALAKIEEEESTSPREVLSDSIRSEEAASPPPPTHEATSSATTLCPQCGLECKNAERLEEHLHNVHWDDPRNEQVDQAMQTAIKEWG